MTFEELKLIKYKTRPWDYPYNRLGFMFNRPSEPGCSDISAHLPFIEYMASQCNVCTEFGTRDCFSTVALLAGCKKTVYSYDLDITYAAKELSSLNLPCYWKLCRANTIEPSFEIEQTDLLFVDTLHTYKQVKQELSQHHTKVNKYIMFHDTFSHGNMSLDVPGEEGIMKAINEFLIENSEWRIVYKVEFNHGLIMVEKCRI